MTLQKIKDSKSSPTCLNLSFVEVFDAILKLLSEREKKIFILRYGIKNKPESLRQVGKKLSISFERVRQIELKIKEKINKNKNKEPFYSSFLTLLDFVEKQKGVILEKELLSFLKEDNHFNLGTVEVLLNSFSEFTHIKKTNKLFEGWNRLDIKTETINSIIFEIISILKRKNKPISLIQIYKYLAQSGVIIPQRKVDFKPGFELQELEGLLKFSKEIKKTIDKKYGLIFWRNVQPKNISDKIYLVLKKYKKPAHYLKIKSLIEKAQFDNKKINIQAVHNELVKNKKFVLIGRGIYALSEWGFRKGTVQDVIKEILEQEGKPLFKDEIIKRVLQERKVTPQTVLINLYEKPNFVLVGKGFYTLKNKK